jgi:hypothetical protein
MHFIRKICMRCNLTARYSDWWYCKNPANFREFTIGRDGAASVPKWCTKYTTQIGDIEHESSCV